MKRVLIYLIAICIVLTLCLTFTSCGHECEFSTDWSKDATHHWHTCINEKCDEATDKAEHSVGSYKPDGENHWQVCAVCGMEYGKTTHVYSGVCDTSCNDCGVSRTAEEHTWDEGVVVSEAAHSRDGEKKFTCSVCGETKIEPIHFTGISFDEWYAAFNTNNFTYTEVAEAKGSGVSSKSSVIYKFTWYRASIKMGNAEDDGEEVVISGTANVDALRKEIIASMKSIAWHNRFAFDTESRSYKPTLAVRIDAVGEYTKDVEIKFDDNNNLVEIKYNVDYEMFGMNYTLSSTITISNHGTTVVDGAATVDGATI
ncbi:MAG: hypothetical protein IJF26_01790 [Clostridia bacterium]|nr:hypothetical protein [Clostridia bacterium]